MLAPALDLAIERLTRDAQARGALSVEREQLDRELGNLGAAIAGGGEVATLVAEIRKRDARRAEIDRVLNRPTIDRAGLKRALEEKTAEWKRLLRSRPTHGQTVLRTILGPIAIGAPEGDFVPWRALARPEGLLSGILSTELASPTGHALMYGDDSIRIERVGDAKERAA